jgi:YD repeat-containing protein
MDEREQTRLEELSRATIAALDTMGQAAAQLAEVEVEGRSPDGTVQVRLTASGRIIQFRLRDGSVRRYSATALGELVTRTLRDAQHRATEAYEREVAKLTPPEVAAAEQALTELWRD